MSDSSTSTSLRTPLSPYQQKVKDEFTRKRGYWAPFWDGMLAISPDYIEHFTEFASIPQKTGTLGQKIRELIYIAIDASATHMYEPGLRIHIRNAFKAGATKEEITDAYQLTTSQGMHTFMMGLPALIDEFRRAGRGAEVETALDERQKALKDEFIAKCGYWTPVWEDLLGLAPEYFEAYLRVESIPYVQGVLPPKVKELILIGVDACMTHLYEPGLRIHIRNAMKHGATLGEIIEVFELVAILGIHTCTTGMPVLVEELANAGQPL
jgi:alkylhydroperoxidase/carboxymuconolactone decarboxylase family protein YurZ